MASAASNCLYKSVTLAVGETFTLPPGAEIISSSGGLESFTSTCPKPTNLETPACYKFRFSGANHDTGSARQQNWEEVNYFVDGIFVNDIYYPFTSSIAGYTGASTFRTAMNSITQFTGIFTNFGNIIGDESRQGGWTNQVNFTTIPSVGDNMYFKVRTGTQWQSPLNGNTDAYVKGDPC
jgi:hypothetical protein